MQSVPYEERIARAKHASKYAAISAANKVDPYASKYGATALMQVKNTLSGAKQRCTNTAGLCFTNYGGRGIKFGFPSIRSAAEWVLDNLGVRPTNTHSLDRVDNNRGYEPGNLRWATRSEQARNKRAYRRTENGVRIRELEELRPDLTYETIRLWILQGATDDEITQRNKYARASV